MVDPCELQVQEIAPGLLVAAWDNVKWCRAEVLFVSDFDVLVSFVDYGCKRLVKVDKVRHLEKFFVTPSRKSCKGSLFGVRPIQGAKQWSVQTKESFKAKTMHFKLWGSIKAHKDGVYELSLIDDLRKLTEISKYLIESGLADPVLGAKSTFNAVLVSSWN